MKDIYSNLMKWSELYYNTVCTNYSLARLLLMVRGGLTLYNDHVINTVVFSSYFLLQLKVF